MVWTVSAAFRQREATCGRRGWIDRRLHNQPGAPSPCADWPTAIFHAIHRS